MKQNVRVEIREVSNELGGKIARKVAKQELLLSEGQCQYGVSHFLGFMAPEQFSDVAPARLIYKMAELLKGNGQDGSDLYRLLRYLDFTGWGKRSPMVDEFCGVGENWRTALCAGPA